LAPELVKRFETSYNQFVLENILKGFVVERSPVIRINTLKTDKQAMMILSEK
jgi:hypothetical protein